MDYSFKNWLAKRESSAFTRTRRRYALGIGPAIPDAALHSRSTAHPGEIELIKAHKKKKKKKRKKKQFDEAKAKPKPDFSIDKWLDLVDSLKKDIEIAEEEKEKEKRKPHPDVEEPDDELEAEGEDEEEVEEKDMEDEADEDLEA
jgi:hypothetical protein